MQIKKILDWIIEMNYSTHNFNFYFHEGEACLETHVFLNDKKDCVFVSLSGESLTKKNFKYVLNYRAKEMGFKIR